jgi:hypothetical protein
MKIPSQELREAFEVVSAVEDDAAIESSHFVKLQQNQKQLLLTLTGTLWAVATAKGNGDIASWTAYVDRRILKAFLASADGKEVVVQYKDKQLTLKANSRIDLDHHAAISGYESWKPASTHDLSEELLDIIRTGVEYLPSKAGADNVAAINLQKDYGVIATDTLFVFGVLGAKLPVTAYIPPAVADAMRTQSGKLAVDRDGVGIALARGVLYEPLSSKLSKYPLTDCKHHLDTAVKQTPLASVRAKYASTVFREAKAFLLDKAEAGLLESVVDGVQLTIKLATGTFRRTIPATLKGTLPETKISVKKFVPWLDLVSKIKDDGLIEIIKIPKALAMRFTNDKKQYVFIAADL